MNIPANKLKVPLEVEDAVKQAASSNAFSLISEHLNKDTIRQEKQGQWTACCPFHDDHSPSFAFSGSGEYCCYGCQEKGGSAISFLMAINGFRKEDYPDLLLSLAQQFNIPVPEDPHWEDRREMWRRHDRLRLIVSESVLFYQSQLMLVDGAKARKYLKEERKITKDIASKYQLGYAPRSGGLIRYLGDKGFGTSEMIAAGVVCEGKNGIRDFMFNRLIIPIYDEEGRAIALAGRVLDDDQKGSKYLNTGKTEIFDKSRVIYGLNFARKLMRSQSPVFLTEGYFDVITSNEAGIPSGCVMGTALGDRLLRLARTNHVVLGCDTDQAGLVSVRNLINNSDFRSLLLSGRLSLRVLTMPEGSKDPDEAINAIGREAFTKMINQAPSYTDWMIDDRAKTYRAAATTEERSEIRKNILDLLSQIASPTERLERIYRLADAIAPGDNEMRQAILTEARVQRGSLRASKQSPQPSKQPSAAPKKRATLRPGEAAELAIARCLLWREKSNWDCVEAATSALLDWECYWPALWDLIWSDDQIRAVDLELNNNLDLPDSVLASLIFPNDFDRLTLKNPLRTIQDAHRTLLDVQLDNEARQSVRAALRAVKENSHAS